MKAKPMWTCPICFRENIVPRNLIDPFRVKCEYCKEMIEVVSLMDDVEDIDMIILDSS